MRKDTVNQINEAVYTLANNFLNPMDGEEAEPITLDDAVDYVYTHLQEYAKVFYGNTSAINFDGRYEIVKEIERQIKENKYIVLKGE